MAHKRSSGAGRNGRDSNAKRRGVKKYGGEYVIPGNIIIRQCGTKIHPGTNVGDGERLDHFCRQRRVRQVRVGISWTQASQRVP